MLKTYLSLIKPGIVRGNAITAAAGALFASGRHIDLGTLLAAVAGLSLVVASACVFNNYLDRDIDAKMARTKNRALAKGVIPVRSALAYASMLGALGFLLLAVFGNLLAAAVALLGFIVYVAVYGYWKRRSSFGTVVGSVAGAVPPVVGYTAVSGRLDLAALILFLVLVFWQMPHFYAIAIFRLKEYKAAGIPVLPAVKDIQTTKVYILGYILAFIAAVAALSLLGYTGLIYMLVMALVSLWWLYIALEGFSAKNNTKWARQLFRVSLIVLLTFSVMISIDTWLP